MAYPARANVIAQRLHLAFAGATAPQVALVVDWGQINRSTGVLANLAKHPHREGEQT